MSYGQLLKIPEKKNTSNIRKKTQWLHYLIVLLVSKLTSHRTSPLKQEKKDSAKTPIASVKGTKTLCNLHKASTQNIQKFPPRKVGTKNPPKFVVSPRMREMIMALLLYDELNIYVYHMYIRYISVFTSNYLLYVYILWENYLLDSFYQLQGCPK